jgi:hypothetical protein
MKRKMAATGIAAALLSATLAGAARTTNEGAPRVFRTDMAGFIQVNDSQVATGGRLAGNGCTYTPTGAIGEFGGMEIKAGGRCARIGSGEIVMIPDFSLGVLGNIQSVQGSVVQRDYVEVGKYVLIAPSGSNQAASVVDGGNYEKIYAGSGTSFIMRLTGVTSDQPIN